MKILFRLRKLKTSEVLIQNVLWKRKIIQNIKRKIVHPAPHLNKKTESILISPQTRKYIQNKIKIYVLCCTEKRFREAKEIYMNAPCLIPILMKYQDVTFENAFWKQLSEIQNEWKDCNYVGVVSCTLFKKMSGKDFVTKLRDCINNNYNSMFFINLGNNVLQSTSALNHPAFMEIYSQLLDIFKYEDIPEMICNYFVCKPFLMKMFMQWFHNVLPIITSQPKIFTNAMYVAQNAPPPSHLLKITGYPYYTHLPFVLERFNGMFFINYNRNLMSLCIVAIFKNEAVIMQEWIDHYIRQGVNHFFLIDNGSTDDYMNILNPFIACNKVTLVVDKRPHVQIEHYNNYFLDKCKAYEWVLVCDFDEFVYARLNFQNIPHYLNTIEHSVSVVPIPWKMFGSSGHIIQPKSVVEGFMRRQRYPISKFIENKCIIRTFYLQKLLIHTSNVSNGEIRGSDGKNNSKLNDPNFYSINENLLSISALHLNHYAIQSLNWFMEVKTTRGAADTAINVRNNQYFKNYDHNEEPDEELFNLQKINII